MARMISVSTEVFAAIWAQRGTGEESEDSILSRILGAQPPSSKPEPDPTPSTDSSGVYDMRNGVNFPGGFEIFRSYKGQNFSAKARDGVWVQEGTGKTFPTLNQLNASITTGAENVWNGNWKYRREDGTVGSINELRR